LTAPGRSEDLSVTKEWEISGTAALHVAEPMSPGYPLKTQKSHLIRRFPQSVHETHSGGSLI